MSIKGYITEQELSEELLEKIKNNDSHVPVTPSKPGTNVIISKDEPKDADDNTIWLKTR